MRGSCARVFFREFCVISGSWCSATAGGGQNRFSQRVWFGWQCRVKTNHNPWKHNKCCDFGTQSNRAYRPIRCQNVLKQWAAAGSPRCIGRCMSAGWNTVTRERKASSSICLPLLIHRTDKATSILESHKSSKYLLVKLEASHKKKKKMLKCNYKEIKSKGTDKALRVKLGETVMCSALI